MRTLPPARIIATAAALAGTGLLGASLGGMASVDRELAAAVPAPSVGTFERVAYDPGAASARTAGTWDDCERPAWRTDHVRSEL